MTALAANHLLMNYHPNRKRRISRIDPEFVRPIALAWAAGSTLSQLSKEYGCSGQTIYSIVKKLPDYEKLKQDREEILAIKKQREKDSHVLTKIHRAGEIDNLKSQGPLNKNIRGRMVDYYKE